MGWTLPAGFARVQSKETGRPGYAPADLLKLYIWLPQPRPIQPSARRRLSPKSPRSAPIRPTPPR
jgi:hypothetical protein